MNNHFRSVTSIRSLSLQSVTKDDAILENKIDLALAKADMGIKKHGRLTREELESILNEVTKTSECPILFNV